LGDFFKFLSSSQGPTTSQNDNLFTVVQNICSLLQIGLLGQPGTTHKDIRSMMGNIAFRAQPLGAHRLHIHRESDVGHATVAQGRAAGEVSNVLNMRRTHNASIIDSHIGKEPVELHILLGVGTNQVMIGQASQREDWLAVELGIVEPIQ
jgi:hypothetical protein